MLQVRQNHAVTAKRGQQTVHADGTVRKQPQLSAPRLRHVAGCKVFPVQKIRNALRQKGTNELRTHDEDRFSCKSVRQMIAGIKNADACDGLIRNEDRQIPDVCARRSCGKHGRRYTDKKVDTQCGNQQERNAHVQINDAAAVQNLRHKQGAQEHQTGVQTVQQQKHEHAL